MSLINKALKKAQTRTQPQGEPSTTPPEAIHQETQHSSLDSTGKGKGRWYLVALLLIPAMSLPILTSKWNREKRHYREEISVLTNTPITPVAKHDFRSTKKTHPITTTKATEVATSPVALNQGGRYLASRTENPAVSKFINQSRISSVRAAGKNSKIVINDRTVSIDNYIDDELPVRVSKVSTNEVVFVDDDGYEYHRHF